MKKSLKQHKQHVQHHTKRVFLKLHGMSIQDEEHLLFSAFIIVLLTIIVINTVYIINKQNVVNSNTETITNLVSKPQKVLTSQQIASSPVYNVSISKVGENDKYDPAFAISDTETMLILSISVTNKSNGVQQFIPSQQLYVRSVDGDYSQLHASSYAPQPIAAATLKPGQTITGTISFNVLKTQTRPLLYVDLGWNNYGPVVFDVLH